MIEGISLFRRTGSSSIIAIGSDSLIDYGKGLKRCLDYGYNHSNKLLELKNDYRLKTNDDSQQVDIPMISIPTFISVSPLINAMSLLNCDSEVVLKLSISSPQVS